MTNDKDVPRGQWTVPQASVWIRTRNLSAAEMLGAHTLMQADDDYPGAGEGHACLTAALRAGHVENGATWELITATGVPVQGKCRATIPLSFWKDDGGELELTFNDPTNSVDVVAAGRGGLRWHSILVDAAACQTCWPHPSIVLQEGPLSLLEAAGRLHRTPIDHLRWLLTHPAVKVTGLNGASQRVMIDLPTLARVSDHKGTENIIRIAGDGPCWWEVTIELADTPIVREQLQKAGVRLAHLLDAALGK